MEHTRAYLWGGRYFIRPWYLGGDEIFEWGPWPGEKIGKLYLAIFWYAQNDFWSPPLHPHLNVEQGRDPKKRYLFKNVSLDLAQH